MDVRSSERGDVIGSQKADVSTSAGDVLVDVQQAGSLGVDADIVGRSDRLFQRDDAVSGFEDNVSVHTGVECILVGVAVGGGGIVGDDVHIHRDVVDGDVVGLGDEGATSATGLSVEGIDGGFDVVGAGTDVEGGGGHQCSGLDFFVVGVPGDVDDVPGGGDEGDVGCACGDLAEGDVASGGFVTGVAVVGEGVGAVGHCRCWRGRRQRGLRRK